jgi:hypothetical protein
MGRRAMHKGKWLENHKERDHYEDIDVGERIILRRILDKQDGVE